MDPTLLINYNILLFNLNQYHYAPLSHDYLFVEQSLNEILSLILSFNIPKGLIIVPVVQTHVSLMLLIYLN